MSYEEEESYEEEDTCKNEKAILVAQTRCHMRRRIHACILGII